jgi:hypothetical protein
VSDRDADEIAGEAAHDESDPGRSVPIAFDETDDRREDEKDDDDDIDVADAESGRNPLL